MKVIDSLIPGSPAWLKSRSASKAPAMMGASKYQTRSDLLKQMATGITPDVDAGTQRLFDAGHASEAAAREIAEDILCDGLSPVCGESDDGYLTASFDGLTFDGKIGFEHKLWREDLAAAVRAEELPEEYKIQMDQQILVGVLDYVLFMCSDGTREKCVSMEYRSTPERAAKLLAAWRQFDADLASYQHAEAAPVAVAEPIKELPALQVEITGAVTASNLVQWKEIVTERIAGINTNLTTDQDFADADSMVKFLDEGEKRIDLVKSQAQANASEIDQVFRALDEIKASMRAKRLELDKLVTKRKESIKVEIMQAGKDELAKHIAGLSKRLGKVQMPVIAADFATAIKGKRNLESMRGAVADLVAAKKIESNEIADRIDVNLKTIAAETEYHFLFSDVAILAMKQPDDLALVIRTRIADHKREEEQRVELVREKIRAEEERKASAKLRADSMNANPLDTKPADPPMVNFHDVATATAREAFKPAEPTHTGMTGSVHLLELLKQQAARIVELEQQRDELLAAVENLIRVKGRHHTEQAYKQLEAAIAKWNVERTDLSAAKVRVDGRVSRQRG